MPVAFTLTIIFLPPNVFFQKQKKTRAEGYDEGDYTLFRSAKVSDFLQTEHPLEVLSLVNQVS